MALVSIKANYQVVIPRRLREEIGLQVGDLLEARVERGKITFTPKTIVDQRIAESFADFKAGRVRGPFKAAPDAIASMRQELRTRRAKRKS